jgi:phosphoglycerate dehydrogenase-like enzyme
VPVERQIGEHGFRARERALGAALDVFAQEPLNPNNPLWELDNVIITSHPAATHDNSARNNLPTIQGNIRRFFGGRLETI